MDGVFSDQERRVFKYFNGAEEVYGDPLAIWRKLLGYFDGDLALALEHAQHEAPGVWGPALGRLVDAVRQAFDMAPFNPKDGTGATDRDCVAALRAWQGWLALKKAPAAS